MSPNPVEDLLIVAGRLEAENPKPGSPEHRVTTAIRAYVLGVVDTLDQALDLTGAQGIATARTRYHRKRRAEFLSIAVHMTMGGSEWDRCKALACEIAAFEGRVWPRWKNLPEPPAGASHINKLLFLARQTGALPKTALGIQKAARKHESGYSVTE